MSAWLPGQSGNPKRNGARPFGSRNRRTTEAIEAIIAAGHQDPLLTLAELQAKSADEGIRATAANMLAPFLHSKCGAMPPFRFIVEPITLPHPAPTTVDQVNANIAHINQAFASGTLDLDFYNALLAGQREHTVSFKAREEAPESQIIKITGGLPELPGTNITMPQLNGSNGNGYQMLVHQNPSSIDGVHTAEPATPPHSVPPDSDTPPVEESS